MEWIDLLWLIPLWVLITELVFLIYVKTQKRWGTVSHYTRDYKITSMLWSILIIGVGYIMRLFWKELLTALGIALGIVGIIAAIVGLFYIWFKANEQFVKDVVPIIKRKLGELEKGQKLIMKTPIRGDSIKKGRMVTFKRYHDEKCIEIEEGKHLRYKESRFELIPQRKRR